MDIEDQFELGHLFFAKNLQKLRSNQRLIRWILLDKKE